MKKTDIAVISFTYRGAELAEHIQEVMDAVWSCKLYTKCSDARAEGIGIPVEQPLAEWTGKQFAAGNALLFIGACGIAVRSIAPHVKDKLSDVPVLVADEAGQFVIPLLAGHYGGANRLAGELSRALGATAVLTTATDVNGLFAVDVFAASNRLAVAGHDGIARVSAGLLRDGYLTMSVAGECEGEIPPGGKTGTVSAKGAGGCAGRAAVRSRGTMQLMADSVLPAAWRRVQKGQKRRGTGSVCAGDPGKREAFQHGGGGNRVGRCKSG